MKTQVVLLGALLAFAPMAGAAETPAHAIAVAGKAEMHLAPDYATIEVGVVTQAKLVGDALAANNARMAAVTAAIKALGIPAQNIQTAKFEIQPKYEPSAGRDYDDREFRAIVGYSVSNSLEITVRDLTKIAPVIDESAKAGANAGGRIVFRVDSLPSRFDEIRRKAVEDALHKAEVLTAAAHTRLGAVLSITDNDASPYYNGEIDLQTVTVTAQRRATPIETGVVRIGVQVTVVFATQ